jgi:hypothetical protein
MFTNDTVTTAEHVATSLSGDTTVVTFTDCEGHSASYGLTPTLTGELLSGLARFSTPES